MQWIFILIKADFAIFTKHAVLGLLDANVDCRFDKMNGVTPIDRTLFKDGASALYRHVYAYDFFVLRTISCWRCVFPQSNTYICLSLEVETVKVFKWLKWSIKAKFVLTQGRLTTDIRVQGVTKRMLHF